jgi:hypothetical protein
VDDHFQYGRRISECPSNSLITYAAGSVYYSATTTYQAALAISYDAGETWPDHIVLGSEGDYRTSCYDVAAAPVDPLIMYAGGEENRYIKIWRTSDGGASWTDVTNNLASLHSQYDYMYKIWVSPEDANVLIAGTTDGVFLTSDGGASWSASTLTTTTVDLVWHPAFDTLYAATTSQGVVKSEDRGSTWQTMNNGLDILNIKCLGLDTRDGWLHAGTYGGSVWRYDLPESPLWANFDEVPASTGGSVDFTLNAGSSNNGRNYLVVGGVTGTEPGYTLPGGLVTLPVNVDVFTWYVVFPLLNTALFSNFMGTLDNTGMAAAQLNAPPVPGYDGIVMYYAYCCNSPFDYVSNPVEVLITP